MAITFPKSLDAVLRKPKVLGVFWPSYASDLYEFGADDIMRLYPALWRTGEPSVMLAPARGDGVPEAGDQSLRKTGIPGVTTIHKSTGDFPRGMDLILRESTASGTPLQIPTSYGENVITVIAVFKAGTDDSEINPKVISVGSRTEDKSVTLEFVNGVAYDMQIICSDGTNDQTLSVYALPSSGKIFGDTIIAVLSVRLGNNPTVSAYINTATLDGTVTNGTQIEVAIDADKAPSEITDLTLMARFDGGGSSASQDIGPVVVTTYGTDALDDAGTKADLKTIIEGLAAIPTTPVVLNT